MAESKELRPSLFDGDDAITGRVNRAEWVILDGRLCKVEG
jgi:hypothetical protein